MRHSFSSVVPFVFSSFRVLFRLASRLASCLVCRSSFAFGLLRFFFFTNGTWDLCGKPRARQVCVMARGAPSAVGAVGVSWALLKWGNMCPRPHSLATYPPVVSDRPTRPRRPWEQQRHQRCLRPRDERTDSKGREVDASRGDEATRRPRRSAGEPTQTSLGASTSPTTAPARLHTRTSPCSHPENPTSTA